MNKAIEVATPVIVVVSGGPAMENLLLREWLRVRLRKKSVYAFASLQLRRTRLVLTVFAALSLL
jgi:hypothetical protein